MSADEPTPAEAEAASAEKAVPNLDFPCRSCGASMTWDPEADALACAYCGARVQVPRDEGTIVERPLWDSAGPQGLGVDVLVSRCSNCGARVAYERSSTAETCVYCGSANVLAQEASRNAIRPESLVPLDVGRDQVRQSFERWIEGLWFRPSALARTRTFEATGIYVPFWTFDCQVHSDWSADAGYFYWVTYRSGGRTHRVRKVRWVPAWGARDDAYDDLLIHASKGLPPALIGELGRFDTQKLVPYRPEYLAGWRAEEYQVDLAQGWQAAEKEIEARQKSRCAGDVPGDTHRSLRVKNAIRDVRWKHVLLPLWSLQYRFGGKTYVVLVHGQTGRVVGKAPWSWIKILSAVLALIVVAAIVLAVLAATQ